MKKRLCFSLKTKCESSANRSSRSITQRLDDYWYGVRFSKLDVPINNLIASKQIDVVKATTPSPFKKPNLWMKLCIHTYRGGVVLAIPPQKVLNFLRIKGLSGTRIGTFQQMLLD